MTNMTQNILNDLTALLRAEEEFVADGVILRNKVIEAALAMNSHLLELLMRSPQIKSHFCVEVAGVLVFDKVKFRDFISHKSFLPDSYTAFRNKIGLVDGHGNQLSQSRSIVLTWPYKDCVLEGGMTKEDRGRDEVFWNTILSPDQITRLYEPKVLTGWERWGIDKKNGGVVRLPVGQVSEHDNLLIDGNNLLSLHSIKSRYQEKIKLIYIDPPYNTGNDGFKYNDRFNHSTWMTFMKNRLEVAKDLLSRDGAIFINIDYNEVHYLKVLMDEIFGRENFQREIIWRIGWLSGYKTQANNFIRNHDTLLFYSKDKNNMKFYKQLIPKQNFKKRFSSQQQKELIGRLVDLGLSRDSALDFLSYSEIIGLPDEYPIEDTWNCSIYDDLNSIAVVSFSGEKVSKLLGVDEIKGQKSEALLKRIIESATKKGDIVLDFFFGTGTTGAVAQKMGRRWIGIEQMDYIKHTTKARLCNVIKGGQEGISKAVRWKGGGSFIYANLALSNAIFAKRIESATKFSDLMSIKAEMQNTGFLCYNVELDSFDVGEFENLSLNDAKCVLMDCLDVNHLYVNLNSIGDEKFVISDEDADLTRAFYAIPE